ncbi:twin-arginine translocase TatA/TatE family subunit [Methanocella sp. MCL-LM]|uniref:twin-arginine translocase TatA/TatE family subunit n=1 Tax=Methanocella sp. MCL-LM TaxID=3412035 RepID=UPI003C752DE9
MVGFDSLLLIGIVALLLFGPDKLPQYLRELGKIYAEIKKAQREFERELNQSQDALVSKPVVRPPSEKVVGIARKMGIATENKTEDQLLSEIAAAVPRQPAAPLEDSVSPQGGKKDI